MNGIPWVVCREHCEGWSPLPLSRLVLFLNMAAWWRSWWVPLTLLLTCSLSSLLDPGLIPTGTQTAPQWAHMLCHSSNVVLPMTEVLFLWDSPSSSSNKFRSRSNTRIGLCFDYKSRAYLLYFPLDTFLIITRDFPSSQFSVHVTLNRRQILTPPNI